MEKVTTLHLPRLSSSPKPTEDASLLPRRFNLAALAVVVTFIFVGTFYSVTTPAFEAGDELWHYPFIKQLADGKGLPVQSTTSATGRYNQEGGQPPLYYALGALATLWIDTGTDSDIYVRNPHASIGIPLRSDNKNMVIHTEKEGFPYSGVFLALHLVRFLSVLMGAATVFLTYLIGTELFPRQPYVALGAAVFNAFLPEFLFVSGSVNNDNLVALLCSAAILLTIRAAKGSITERGVVILSLVVGMASLSKLGGIALIPLISLVAFADSLRKQSLAPIYRFAAPVWISSAVIAGWWYVRNWQLYGDPLGLNIFLKLVGERSPKPGVLEILATEGEGLRLSFWGVFGGFNVLASPAVYGLFDVLSILATMGLVMYAVSGRVRNRFEGAAYPLAFATLWVLVITVSFLRWTQLTLASQGRLLFPALSVIAVWFAVGILSLAPRRLAPIVVGTLAIVTISASVAVPVVSILPAYPKPVLLTSENARGFQRPLGIDFEGKMKLLGIDLPAERVKPGEVLTVTLYLLSQTQMERNYSVFIHVFAANGDLVGQMDSYPGRGALSTSLWKPGYAIKDTYQVPISLGPRSPGVLRVEVGVYGLDDMVPLRASDPTGKPLGTSPVVARVKLIGEETAIVASPHLVGSLDDKVGLLGYHVENGTVSPGGVLKGSLIWRALRKPDRDYSVFVQLVGNGGLAGQYDSYPQQGAYPTTFWDEGEAVDDWFEMRVKEGLPEGDYDLIVGMYDLASGVRLPAGADTFIRVQRIHIEKD